MLGEVGVNDEWSQRLNASIKVTMHVMLVGEHEEKVC